jgi:hypothetical protein
MFFSVKVIEKWDSDRCVNMNVVCVLRVINLSCLWNRITGTVRASGGLREKLFNVAYNSKKQALEKGEIPRPQFSLCVVSS